MAQLGSLSQETETLSHVLRLVQAFRAFDSDNDGSITAAELGGIMGSLGYNTSEQEVKAMMRRGDRNRDGRLSIEEFLEMNSSSGGQLGLGSLGECLGTAFEALMADFESGEAVTGEDLHGVMRREVGPVDHDHYLSLEDCQAIVASMDADGDGAVSLEEFRLMLNSFL